MPNFSAARIVRGPGDGTEDVGAAFEAKQSEESEDQGFFVVDGHAIGDDHLMLGVFLDPLDEITVERSAAGDEHLALRQHVDGLGNLHGDVLHKGSQSVIGRAGLQKRFLMGLEELASQRFRRRLTVKLIIVERFEQLMVDMALAG